MKKDELIYQKKFLTLLSMIAVGLFVLSGYLYSNNQSYKEKNTRLILQNDSLMSVNLQLRAEANKMKQGDYTKQTVRVNRN